MMQARACASVGTHNRRRRQLLGAPGGAPGRGQLAQPAAARPSSSAAWQPGSASLSCCARSPAP